MMRKASAINPMEQGNVWQTLSSKKEFDQTIQDLSRYALRKELYEFTFPNGAKYVVLWTQLGSGVCRDCIYIFEVEAPPSVGCSLVFATHLRLYREIAVRRQGDTICILGKSARTDRENVILSYDTRAAKEDRF